MSKIGIQVDKAKIDIIAKLPYPVTVKYVRPFISHAGFYRRLIEDFAKIAQPMTHLLKDYLSFNFDEASKGAHDVQKKVLVTSPVIRPPKWGMPFEIMRDASGYAVRAILGKKHGKDNHVIYYTSKTLNPAQCNYTTMEKEMLAVVFVVERFISYLHGAKVIMFTNHTALKYLMTKK